MYNKLQGLPSAKVKRKKTGYIIIKYKGRRMRVSMRTGR